MHNRALAGEANLGGLKFILKIMLSKVVKVYRSSATMVALRLIGAAAAIAMNFVLAREMSADQLAAAWTTVSMSIVGTIFLTLGVDAASVRIITRRLTVGDLPEAAGFAIFSLRLTWVLSAAWITGFGAAAYFLSNDSDSLLRERLIFIGAVAPIIAQMRVLSMHTMADGRPVIANLPGIFLLPLLQLVLLGLASLVFLQISVLLFLTIYASSVALGTIIQAMTSKPLRERLRTTEPDFRMWPAWMITGGLLAVPALLTDFSRDIISALSVTVLDAQNVAILVIALKLSAFLRFGIIAVNQVFATRLAAAIAKEDDAEIERVVAVSTLLKAGPVAVLILILQLAATDIMTFFSLEFASGGPVLVILTLETLILVLCGPSAPFMSLGKGHHVLPILALISVATMCTLTLILGPRLGAVGAAWAFSIGWSIWAVLGLIYVRRSTGHDISIISAVRWGLQQRKRQ